MTEKKSRNSKKIFANVIWTFVGIGIVVLLGAAINIKNLKHCKGVEIAIDGVKNNFFIDNIQVRDILERLNGGALQGKQLSSLNIAKMESELKKNIWINSAELFFDNNDILKINVKEREPIARIFTNNGSSFYIDSSLSLLPLSNKFSAKVPVFTNYPSTKPDTNLLTQIKNISTYILNDPFWMAQIDQVDITANKTFEMVPNVGNHIIVFGSAENYAEKFSNLLTFYKQVETKVGWSKYSKINVEYKNQIVAVKRGAEDVMQDSIRAKQLMIEMAAMAQKQANDSISNIQLAQPQDDNIIPLAPDAEYFPDEKASKNSLTVLPKIISLPNEKPNTAVKNLSNSKAKNNPMLKKSSLQSGSVILKQQTKKQVINKIKIPSHEKPNPIPAKPAVKPAAKQIDKPKSKPATQPNNDY